MLLEGETEYSADTLNYNLTAILEAAEAIGEVTYKNNLQI